MEYVQTSPETPCMNHAAVPSKRTIPIPSKKRMAPYHWYHAVYTVYKATDLHAVFVESNPWMSQLKTLANLKTSRMCRELYNISCLKVLGGVCTHRHTHCSALLCGVAEHELKTVSCSRLFWVVPCGSLQESFYPSGSACFGGRFFWFLTCSLPPPCTVVVEPPRNVSDLVGFQLYDLLTDTPPREMQMPQAGTVRSKDPLNKL